jgi:hypothetical protein
MSSSNPYLGVAHYSLMNAIELFKKGEEERHRLGAIILIDLSVESALKAKLYELKPLGIQEEIFDFVELLNQIKINVPISNEEELKLRRVHEVRNSSQHGGSIPDSFNMCEYLKWASMFVKRFSIDNFGVNIDSKMPLNLRRILAELTSEKGMWVGQRYELKEPLDENYETVRNWFKRLDASSRVGSLSEEGKQIRMNVILQYCNYVEKDPNQIIEHAKNEFYSTGKQEAHDQSLANFVNNLPEGKTRRVYWSHVRSFYRENEIRILTTPSPKYQPKHVTEEITTEEIRKICEKATIKHGSWIIANSYMGLNVGKIRHLKVEDFHTDKWVEPQNIYPVSISMEVSRTFPYTTFIGSDAKELLNKYFFIENHFGLKDLPWDMIRQDFTISFRYYSDKAEVTSPDGFAPITSMSLKKRLESILKDSVSHKQWYIVDYLLGRKSEVLLKKLPLLDDKVKNAYLKAFPKLQIFEK